MAKQKKILDITEGRYRLICIQTLDRVVNNPYSVYAVISAPGSPLRKRLLIRYGDFMSVLYFIMEFYRDGMDALPLCEVRDMIKKRTI